MKKIIIYVFLMVAVSFAQQNDRIKIGLALRGGGALGFAHIGALAVIDSLEIPIDYVAGTSMGGLVGALYAMGYSAEEMEALVLSFDWQDIFNDNISRDYLPYMIKKNSGKYQIDLDISGYSPTLPVGLIPGQKIYDTFFFITYLYEGIKSFDDLPISFRCIGADLVSGEEVIFSKGSLAKAMRATMSIPTIFDPIQYNDSLIIDGGMTNNFPVDVTKNMGSDLVIGLNLVSAHRSIDYYDNLFKILDRSIDVPRKTKLQQTIDMADILLQQDITGFTASNFDTISIKKIIQRGRMAAYDQLERLITLKHEILNQDESQLKQNTKWINQIDLTGNSTITKSQLEKILYIKEGKRFSSEILNKRLRKFNSSTVLAEMKVDVEEVDAKSVNLKIHINQVYSPVMKEISITGNREIPDEFIVNYLGIQVGEKIDISELDHRISLLYALDYFSVIRYSFDQHDDRTISFNLIFVERSPYKFFLGIHYDDFYKLVGAVGFRFNSPLIPGLLVNTELQFSGLTRFRTDIVYPSRSLDLRIYPALSIGYYSIPKDVFNEEGVKIFRFDDTQWNFGGGIALSPTRFMNITGELFLQLPDVKLKIGFVDSVTTKYTDNIVSANFNFDIDVLDNLLIPRRGIKFAAQMEISSKKIGSTFDYARLESYFDLYQTFYDHHTLRLNGSYLRSWETDPVFKTLFFIGGPVSFFGLDYSQGMGTEFLTLRTDYRWEFLENLYVNGIVNISPRYKIGFPGSETTGKTLWGFGFGVMYNSILGPIEMSFSWGDKSPYNPGTYVSRIYFSAGYLL